MYPECSTLRGKKNMVCSVMCRPTSVCNLATAVCIALDLASYMY